MIFMRKTFRSIILGVFLQVFILNTLACKDNFPRKTMPLVKSEIEYDYDKMIDAQKDQPSDKTSYDYSLVIINAEKEFLKKCKTINNDKSLIGDWKLFDEEGNEIKNHSFYFNEFISISKYKDNIVLDNWGNRSVLYRGSNNRYYIFTRGIGIIRMIKIQEDKLFVYIVKNKKWVLDPIHKEGEYIFKKISNESNIHSIDMNSWVEGL